MTQYEMCPNCLGTKKIDKNCNCEVELLKNHLVLMIEVKPKEIMMNIKNGKNV
jgi:hypothetical protein